MKYMHKIQMQILRDLLFSEGLCYSELKPSKDLENNKFSFHLNKLVTEKLVQKIENKYSLTDSGKEYANTMDTDSVNFQKQTKVSAITCAYKKINDSYEFLIYTRLKQPFYGHQGFPSGKVKWGEKIIDACRREFFEETQLIGNPELFTIQHHHVYNKNTKSLLEDKTFFFFRIINPKGQLQPNSEGKFEWVKEHELTKYLTRPFGPVNEMLRITQMAKSDIKSILFKEIDEFTTEF